LVSVAQEFVQKIIDPSNNIGTNLNEQGLIFDFIFLYI
jgi:hypothetical protein